MGKLLLASLLLLVPASLAHPQSPLGGNWRLRPTSTGSVPLQSLDLAVGGTAITATTYIDVPCSATVPGRFSGGRALTGHLAPDGTFTLETLGTQPALTLHGAAPKNPGQPWTGTYTLTIPAYKPFGTNPYGPCDYPQTGSFTATPGASISGTYTGALVGRGFGADVTLTLTITQAPVDFQSTKPLPPIALTATAEVHGSPCFTHGVSRGTFDGNYLNGNHFTLNLDMAGQGILMLSGKASEPTFATLQDVEVEVGGLKSPCFPARGTATLTRH